MASWFKMCIEMQRTKDSQGNLKEENKAGGFIVPYIKIHYETVVIKTMCYWHKDGQVGQWTV